MLKSSVLKMLKIYNVLLIFLSFASLGKSNEDNGSKVLRSFWFIPKGMQEKVNINAEHELCMVIFENLARLDEKYVKGCEKWLDFHFYQNFSFRKIDQNQRVPRSFWFVSNPHRTETLTKKEHEYCNVILENFAQVPMEYVKACLKWNDFYFSWQNQQISLEQEDHSKELKRLNDLKKKVLRMT